VFVARVAGLPVFDPLGDRVGRVRDVVTVLRPGRESPRAVGLVVEIPGRRRVFLAMSRVTSIDSGQVISTGLVNLRRFEQRPTETLVLGELLDRTVRLRTNADAATDDDRVTIEDVAIEQGKARDWKLSRAYVRRVRPGRLRRRGEAFVVPLAELDLGVVEQRQGAANLLAAIEELKAPDLADVIHQLAPKRRVEVAAALDDERLADVLEELPEDDQVAILSQIDTARAADVLEAMQPDDAADLLNELPQEQAELLLALMDPEEAADVRRLLTYEEDTAGGLMTTDPIVLSPDASVAEALARVRREEISPAIAAAVFVCRPPLDTPTGRYIGLLHIQRMLREPPGTAVGSLVDRDIEAVPTSTPIEQLHRRLAIYNLVSLPVTDDAGRLVGVVTVDDVLDHTLPPDWRDHDDDLADVTGELPRVR
jgi:Mg/Co/Ni transporter MgtE